MARIFGVDIGLSKSVDKKMEDLQKQIVDAKFGNYRTIEDPTKTLGGDIVRIPYYPLPMKTIYDVSAYSDTLRVIHRSLKTEIFREGYEISEKFAMKCNECEKEFEHPVDECEQCKSRDLRKPEPEQRTFLEKFSEHCNENEQSILEVSKMIEDDENIIDDGYMLVQKDYYFNEEKEMIGNVVVEVIRVHPTFIRIVADKTGRPGRDSSGKEVKTCLIHRSNVWQDRDDCPHCEKKLHPAYFKGDGPDGKPIYYIKGEVLHKSKYMPSLTYGFSPVFSIWMKVVTLMNQDKYIKDYYAKGRSPKGILFIRTPNLSSLEKTWKWMIDQWKQNPHTVPPLAIEGSDIKGKFVEFVDFMRSLDEMQFIETRNEFRRVLGSVYGVMPLFQADLTQSGGLNNEGLQITVTNRAIQDGQKLYNEGFFPWLLKQLEITDYVLKLKPSEERDEMHDMQLQSQNIQNARMMQSMGYDVTLNADNEFEYEPTEVPVEPPEATGEEGLPQIGTSGLLQEPQRFSGEPQKVQMLANKLLKSIDKVKKISRVKNQDIYSLE